MTPHRERLRDLPSVDRLLSHPGVGLLLQTFSRPYVRRGCQRILQDIREQIRRGIDVEPEDLADDVLVARLERLLRRDSAPALVRVVNATGTVLHTNLGRAPLAPPAVEAIALAAAEPVNVEYDLEGGERGRRESRVEALLCELTGAEAATVVNNNAAAVLLCLNTLATGREVIVSRGELVEIGGAFRLPEIMARSGAILREVGTTNRTHPADYERAIGPNTGFILKVHTSNYRVVGFSAEVDLPTLVDIGAAHGVPVMHDLGSGALVDLRRYGLPGEPVVAEQVASGADVVTFSGDKLLGGPQSGLIVGRARWLEAIARNPIHRAVRCGKLTIAALEATLRIYRQSADPAGELPALAMLLRPAADVERAAQIALPLLRAALGDGFDVSIETSTSQIGSGALPTEEIPTWVLAIRHGRLGAGAIAARFRRAHPPILGRVHAGVFLLDLRTVRDPRDLVPAWPLDA
jgi:L-seryl-tRNA(Ser) seleniumtransferase